MAQTVYRTSKQQEHVLSIWILENWKFPSYGKYKRSTACFREERSTKKQDQSTENTTANGNDPSSFSLQADSLCVRLCFNNGVEHRRFGGHPLTSFLWSFGHKQYSVLSESPMFRRYNAWLTYDDYCRQSSCSQMAGKKKRKEFGRSHVCGKVTRPPFRNTRKLRFPA